MKSAITTASSRLPDTSQNTVFWTRRVKRQPPDMTSAERMNISTPSAICQFFVWMSWPQRTSVALCEISPTPVSPGASPMVTKAMPKKAFESSPARVMQNDEMIPTAGWMTRLTSM